MNDLDIYSSGPLGLASLVRNVMADEVELTDQELADILGELLSAPIIEKVQYVEVIDDKSMTKISWNQDAIHTMRDLFAHDRPPLGLLKVVKQYAKHMRTDLASTPSPKVCSIIYYASIAAAKVRLGQSITTLDPVQAQQGIRWAGAQPWAGEPIHGVLCSAVGVFDQTRIVGPDSDPVH